MITFRKAAALVFAISAIFQSSCAAKSPVAMTYGESNISESVYNYYVSTYKGRYIESYSDINDSYDFWESDLGDGVTGEEKIAELILENTEQTLVAAEEFRKAGLVLSKDERDTIDKYIDDMTDELASGSRKTLNAALSEFSINANMLRDIFIMERKAALYFEYLYGKDGTETVSDTDREEYYKNNYVRFQQIYINNITAYETDSDGTILRDDDGNYKTRDLTDEERAAANEKIDEVKRGLEAGEDFDALKDKYSDSKDYARGYYFSAQTSTDYITSIVSEAFKLDEGEWTYVYAAAGSGAFFIKRLPLDDGAYKNEECADFFENFDDMLKQDAFSEMMESHFSEIGINDEFISSVSVADAPVNYFYY